MAIVIVTTLQQIINEVNHKTAILQFQFQEEFQGTKV